jgi:hypothetical protein
MSYLRVQVSCDRGRRNYRNGTFEWNAVQCDGANDGQKGGGYQYAPGQSLSSFLSNNPRGIHQTPIGANTQPKTSTHTDTSLPDAVSMSLGKGRKHATNINPEKIVDKHSQWIDETSINNNQMSIPRRM